MGESKKSGFHSTREKRTGGKKEGEISGSMLDKGRGAGERPLEESILLQKKRAVRDCFN